MTIISEWKLGYDFSVHMQEDIPDTMIEMPK